MNESKDSLSPAKKATLTDYQSDKAYQSLPQAGQELVDILTSAINRQDKPFFKSLAANTGRLGNFAREQLEVMA